ncbi:MAG: two-component sensor histidine kinase [Flavobacteriales bacterium]|nr:MAG: two-component sensor histidine kinase [Flavobacteriales bacterium]
MNNKFIPIISFFMTISLLVFVAMQFYWLRDYYDALEQDFSNKVHSVLENTTKKINDIEVEKYYAKYKDFDKSIVANGNKPTYTITQSIEDKESKRQITTYKSIIASNEIPISNDGDSLKVTKMYTDESLINIQKNQNTPEQLTADLDREIASGEFDIKEFAKINANHLPIEERVEQKVLAEVLQKELKRKGINADFGFGVIDVKDKKVSIFDSIYQENKTKKEYTYPLFTDRKDKALYDLSVVFPKKGYVFAKSNWFVLVGTLISLLTILVVYIFSVYYMLKQKKISEIKTDFINNMSHEFKTPIATISVATDSLASDRIAHNPEKVKYYSSLIKNENLRMKKQVETVLSMSKLERNEVQLFLKEMDAHDLIDRVCRSFNLIIEKRDGTLKKSFLAEKSTFKIDEFHFSNVMTNLLDNANKYSPESPVIQVETSNENDFFVVAVSDKGMGMDAQNISKIFDKFFREETGNIHNVKGQGLGLSYVKKIIALFGGDIKVVSQKGKGTTFTIKIPMNK